MLYQLSAKTVQGATAMCSKIYMSEERRCNLLAESWYGTAWNLAQGCCYSQYALLYHFRVSIFNTSISKICQNSTKILASNVGLFPKLGVMTIHHIVFFINTFV